MTAVHRYFIDFEFAENGETIKPISFACVPEHRYGEDPDPDFYCVFSDGWRPEDCNDFVQKHVLPQLRADHTNTVPRQFAASYLESVLLDAANRHGAKLEFWGYYCAYDWVALAQLFGEMISLPTGFPQHCMDLKQEMERLGLTRSDLPAQDTGNHNALHDAMWVREAFRMLQDRYYPEPPAKELR